MVLAAAFAAPLAHAQWSVKDQDAIDAINKHLNLPDNGVTSVTESGTPGLSQAGPSDPASSPWGALDNITQPCQSMPKAQGDVCFQIANARSAYYDYMKAMYTTNKSRYKLLYKLIETRNQIRDKTQFGVMQSLTNEIQALQALIMLDRQQTETVAHGYKMRIEYLNGLMTQTAKAFTSGNPSNVPGNNDAFAGVVSSALGNMAAQSVLCNGPHGLDTKKDTPPGYQPLFNNEKSFNCQ
jgi:hypothetical protein